MIELRLVSREGDYLVLESQAGERFRLLVEDSLRELTRVTAKAQTGTSPKEIQALIRSGLTVAEVAVQTGEGEEFVSLFAGAVLDELNFVLEAALSIQLPEANSMVRFSELVAKSFPVLSWQVAKQEGRWVLTAAADSASAQWVFSPSDMTLEPLNQQARDLFENQRPSEVRPTSYQNVGPSASTTEKAAPEGERPAASVLDLVSEIRRRDTSSAQSTSTPVEEKVDAAESTPAKPASAKGRASLPSWDEIVSGTSPEEEF